MPANAIRGIGRWCSEYALALRKISPGTIAAVSVDDELPLPAVVNQLLALGVPALPTSKPPRELGDDGLIFHVMSPLEDLPIERIWPKWARNPSVGLVATLFDMIPMLFPDDYFQGSLKRLLQVRYELYREADAIIGISQATADDAVRLLDVEPAKTFVASGGISDRFAPHRSGRAAAHAALTQVGVDPDFLLTIGNVDPRKNVLSLMAAYSTLQPALRQRHQLVITCSQADSRHLEHLRANAARLGIEDRIVLMPYVNDHVMVALYQACALMVYPSLYEGLGLPIIEAQACGAAVLVSDVGPMREIVSEVDARFDPTDVDAIRGRLQYALSNRDFLNRLRAVGLQDAKRYSWDHSAAAALAAYSLATR